MLDKIKNLFTEHPAAVDETYFQHLSFALGSGVKMFFSSIAIILHGIFPFLFVKTGSDCILSLYGEMKKRNAPGTE